MADWPLTAPDGAYEIGGGDFSFGQNMTEQVARAMFEIPDFNAGNALEVLETLLLKMPLEALQRFASFIPDAIEGAFNTVTGAVQTILGALTEAPRILDAIIQQLNAILSDVFGGLDLGNLPSPQEFWQFIVDTLFVQLPSRLFGVIPAASITSRKVNLLANSGFEGAVSLQGGTVWRWEAAEGRTSLGSAWTTADGTLKVLVSNPMAVAPGQKIVGADGTSPPSIWVKTDGYAGTGTPIRLIIREYLDGAAVNDHVLAQSAGSEGAWSQLSGTYTVPAGVDQLKFRLVVDPAATAGDVGFDDGNAWLAGNGPFSGILDMFNLGALEDLLGIDVDASWSSIITNLLNPLSLLSDDTARQWVEDTVDQLLDALGISPLGSVFDKILDLADEIGDWLFNTEGTQAEMTDTFGELEDLFQGTVLDPLTALGGQANNWFNQFFRGGSEQVVTQNRIAEPSGIPPMGADVKVPWAYLPVELMQVALGGPWANVTKSANQAITASTDTLVTGLSQAGGPATLVIAGNKFKFPFDGLWNLEIVTKWSGSSIATGTPQTINLKQNSVQIRDDVSFGTATNKINLMLPAATADEFGVYAYTASGGLSVLAAGTFIQATYLGATTVPSLPPPPDPVTFDSAGAGDSGHKDTLTWNHTFGPNANTIYISVDHEHNGTPVVMVGPHNVPVVSGPTYVGAFSGFNSYLSVAMAILPTSVRGTTQTITVTHDTERASSAGSSSYNGVGSIGEVVTSGGSSSPSLLVPSNVSSMVAMSFGGVNSNFSSFNRTLDFQTNFVSFSSWAHLMGHAVGGSLFTASGGRWVAKGIELHP